MPAPASHLAPLPELPPTSPRAPTSAAVAAESAVTAAELTAAATDSAAVVLPSSQAGAGPHLEGHRGGAPRRTTWNLARATSSDGCPTAGPPLTSGSAGGPPAQTDEPRFCRRRSSSFNKGCHSRCPSSGKGCRLSSVGMGRVPDMWGWI
ncbi:hypothetical protein PVAP13_9NG174673 [Panicum virgatum]|uniref:Uncharacterized protein n=1 Tax=Panicum virgatum TaxID=38727 RepID=A0A8T0MJF9_PANVG|nr:hypothetical protein PVAP13_9NG174673 [Panicum virgatum]